VLFLWTPPHFWSLAIAAHDDYASVGVPMLPVISGDALTAKVIFAHTATLVALSMLPVFWSMGPVYLTGAVAGGALFLWTSIRLVRTPSRKRAIQNFLASLLQLVLLLSGAIADRIIGAY
jgi:protoheme IX farnesyltransferase